jgi:hypothetical protein
MTLMVHEFVGAAFSGLGLNPVETFGLGLASHYVLDAIPHWDYLNDGILNNIKMGPNGKIIFKSFRKEERRAFFSIVFDIFGGAALSLLLLRPATFGGLINLGAGMFGAFLPDFLGGLSYLFPQNALLQAHYRFHNFIHTKSHIENHPFIGAGIQAAIILLVVLIYRGFIKI